MIAYIKGTLLEVWDRYCMLLTDSGLGYEVAIPSHTQQNLPAIGEDVRLFTSLVCREDAMELYGFETFAEKRAFEALLGISKIGARTALAILSTFRPQDLVQLTGEGDYKKLTTVSGIGLKTAQHIILELKYRLTSFSPAIPAGASSKSPPMSSLYEDVLAVLANLGYDKNECGPKIRDILNAEPDLDMESAIRAALKAMARGKA